MMFCVLQSAIESDNADKNATEVMHFAPILSETLKSSRRMVGNCGFTVFFVFMICAFYNYVYYIYIYIIIYICIK